MTDVKITVDLGAVPKALARQRSKDLVHGAQRAAVDAAGPFLQRQLMLATPTGATGQLRINTIYEPGTFAGEAVGFVGPVGAPSLYAEVVELGRRPGKQPPIAPIAYWVRRVIKPPEEQVDSIAFLVARAIGRHGTKATHYIRDTADKNRGRAQLLMRRAAVDYITGRIKGVA